MKSSRRERSRSRERRRKDGRSSLFDFSEKEGRHGKRKRFEDVNAELQGSDEDYGGYVRPKAPAKEEEAPVEKEEPCFDPSGILAEFSNNVKGVVLKFTEPMDAAVPSKKEEWKVYPFKGDQSLGKFNSP